MTDTNGYVDPSHLATYQGVPVSLAILSDLRAAGTEFRASGYTFSIARPWGGYRPFIIQGEMRTDFLGRQYARFNLSPPPSPAPARAGFSRHGFGRAIDVISNAPLAKRDEILAKHGFHLWEASDRNHYEWGNVLEPADVSSVALDNTTKETDVTDTVVFQMTDDSDKPLDDWSRIGPRVLPVGTFAGGYEATADEDVARLWINGSGQTATGPIRLRRAAYLAQQQWGAKEYTLHRSDDIARIKEALGGATASFPKDYVTKTDLNNATTNGVAAVVKAIPTTFKAA